MPEKKFAHQSIELPSEEKMEIYSQELGQKIHEEGLLMDKYITEYAAEKDLNRRNDIIPPINFEIFITAVYKKGLLDCLKQDRVLVIRDLDDYRKRIEANVEKQLLPTQFAAFQKPDRASLFTNAWEAVAEKIQAMMR